MRYRSAEAFRIAIEDRIKGIAVPGNQASLVRLRRSITFDRFLARLTAADFDNWILKGALALDWRFGHRSRTTRDIDIAWQSSADQISENVLLAASLDLGDFFSFVVTHRGTREIESDLTLVRFHVAARLANRRFEETRLDVVTPAHASPLPVRLSGPDFLRFAGFEPVSARVLALEQHVAEKVHAYVQTYTDGRYNTRAKDLVDLVVISELATFVAHKLRQAIDAAFAVRTPGGPPSAVSSPPDRWRTRYAEMAIAIGIDPDLASAHGTVASFLDPILNGTASNDMVWNPVDQIWTTPIGNE